MEIFICIVFFLTVMALIFASIAMILEKEKLAKYSIMMAFIFFGIFISMVFLNEYLNGIEMAQMQSRI